jgi:cysteine desulfurase/selenocysteine lyase
MHAALGAASGAPAVAVPADALDELDAAAVKADFPILDQVDDRGNPLVYLDSASSSQKPAVVLDALDDHCRHANANIHRGRYALSDLATARYERAREQVAAFIGAEADECVFVRNTTEAINLVAHSWGRRFLQPGDLVLGTLLDHHANIVPWQLATEERGAKLRHVRVTFDGRLDMDHLDALLALRPKLVGFPLVSNAIGSTVDAVEVVRRARAAGALTLIDAAQGAPHLAVDVRALGCDFLALSGHKLLAPMGSGVLFARAELLEAMPPFMTGGGMVRRVSTEGATWVSGPQKFEAGTPAVGEAVALGVAVGYLAGLGLDRVHRHEIRLAERARAGLESIPGVTVHGPLDPAARSGIVSFTAAASASNATSGANAAAPDRLDPLEIAARLDEANVAVRAGMHCCHPLFDALGLDGIVRASFYVYNTDDDADRLVAAVAEAVAALRPRARRADPANPCGRFDA